MRLWIAFFVLAVFAVLLFAFVSDKEATPPRIMLPRADMDYPSGQMNKSVISVFQTRKNAFRNRNHLEIHNRLDVGVQLGRWRKKGNAEEEGKRSQ